MASHRFLRSLRVPAFALLCLSAVSFLQAQGAKQTVPQNSIPDSDADHIQERNEWFFRGRLVHGKASPELRRRVYQNKVQMRARPNTALASPHATGPTGLSSGSWTPLGPIDGNGRRASRDLMDPADTSGNMIYIGRDSYRSETGPADRLLA
jgi:hypothetical protein